MSNISRILFLGLCFTIVLLELAHSYLPCEPPNNNFRFCNTKLPVETRAVSLISMLTIDEKINQLADNASEIPRLSIPAYQWWSESLHGISDNGPGVSLNGAVKSATCFPQVIVSAAAFNRSLWRSVAAAIAVEARAMYNLGQAGLTFWAPNINVFRDPRWGRGQETPGEDPVLTSAYAFEYVRGFQGQDDEEMSDGLMLSACCKHYTAYDLDKWGGHTRNDFNALVTRQDMEDTYQPPFKACIQKGKATCLMCSYNRVNGIPSCADGDMLKKVRNEWGFKGYITSDCDAVQNIFENHNFSKTPEDAVAVALKAGTDIDCGNYMKMHMKSALEQGKVTENDMDKALFNLFSVLIRVGLFDGNPANSQFANFGTHDICSSQHRNLALDAAKQGIVLLKNNDKFLPWNKNKVSSLAVIGPMANSSNINGDYTGNSCSQETFLEGLQSYAKSTFYAPGCEDVSCDSASGIPEAVSIAREAGNVVLVVGLDLSQETEELDRYSLLLPGYQMDLIKSVAAVSRKPLVIVLTGGGPVDISFLKENPKVAGIIWIGYPGETGGRALSETLFGDHNPGGRLPVTWYPASFTRIPMSDMNMRPDPARGYPGRTYRFYTGETVYEFGHGLSYSKFSYRIVSAPETLTLSGNIRPETMRDILLQKGSTFGYINVDEIASCDSLRFSVEVSVRNHEEFDGSQAILLFSRVPNSYPYSPQKQLIGFDQIHVVAYKSAETSILVDPCEHLSIVDEDGVRILPLGDHTLMVEDIKRILTIEA